MPSSPAIAAMASICSCWLGRAPCGVRRRFAARSLRAKICVWWQLSAVVQRQPSARAATFCVPILQKKMGLRAGPCAHGASRRHLPVHRVVSNQPAVVWRLSCPNAGPRARRAGHQGRRNATKASETPQGVIETSVWVRSGSFDYLDWPLVSDFGWRQKQPKAACQNSSLSLPFIGIERCYS